MRKFIPYPGKVEIAPMREDSMVKGELDSKLEMGTVISAGAGCRFLRKGDTVFFAKWGFSETPDDQEQKHFVVEEDSRFILGKYEGAKAKKNGMEK